MSGPVRDYRHPAGLGGRDRLAQHREESTRCTERANSTRCARARSAPPLIAIIALLAACATVDQPKLVARAPPPQIVYVNVPVRCVKAKPEIPKTAITPDLLAGAEAAVAALAKPQPDVANDQLKEWIGAIDHLMAALLVDMYKLKSYTASADPLLTECMVEPAPVQP